MRKSRARSSSSAAHRSPRARKRARSVRILTIAPGEPFQRLDLWLALTTPGFCRLIAQPEALDDGRVTPAFRWGDAAVASSDSLAYLTIAHHPRPRRFRQCPTAHRTRGVLARPHRRATPPDTQRPDLTWGRDHATGPGPRIEVHSAHQDPTAGQIIIGKRQTSLAISWPAATSDNHG